jgi:hypothetical protein
MTTSTLLDAPWRPAVLGSDDNEAVERASGGGPTLDEIIVDAWEGLASGRPAPCPVCGGGLTPRFGAGSGPVGGRCRDCGSELS